MSAMPQSPAAYVAQSVASAAVASPQQPMTGAPQQAVQPQAAAAPNNAAPVMAQQGTAAPQMPQQQQQQQQQQYNNNKKPRSRPGSGSGGYDVKQHNKMGYQHQLPHHAANGSFVGHGGATAAVPIGGAMQPLMFAYQAPPQQNNTQQAFGAAGNNANGSAYPPQYMPFAQPQQAQPQQGQQSMLPPQQGVQSTATAPIALGANGQPLPAGAAGAAAAGAEGSLRKVIKVSSKSNVKSVAGAISHTTRAGESPTLMATGSESVNQSVKAIAIARGYLSENKLDVSCQPVFRNQEKGAITFVLSKGVLRGKKPGEDDDIQQLRVARGSDPNSVAGSIANKVRNGERVLVQSIGAGSVDITVRAITLARRFLEGDAIDVCFRPEFIHVKLDEGERSAVKFTILAQQV